MAGNIKHLMSTRPAIAFVAGTVASATTAANLRQTGIGPLHNAILSAAAGLATGAATWLMGECLKNEKAQTPPSKNLINDQQKAIAMAFRQPIIDRFPNINFDVLDQIIEGKVNPTCNAVLIELSEKSKECGLDKSFFGYIYQQCIMTKEPMDPQLISNKVGAAIQLASTKCKLDCQMSNVISDIFISSLPSGKKNQNYNNLLKFLLINSCKIWHNTPDGQLDSSKKSLSKDSSSRKVDDTDLSEFIRDTHQGVTGISDTLVGANKSLHPDLKPQELTGYDYKCGTFRNLTKSLPLEYRLELAKAFELSVNEKGHITNLEQKLTHELEKEILTAAEKSLKANLQDEKDIETLDSIKDSISEALKLEELAINLARLYRLDPKNALDADTRVMKCIANTAKEMSQAVAAKLSQGTKKSIATLDKASEAIKPFLTDETERAKLMDSLIAEDDALRPKLDSKAKKGKRKKQDQRTSRPNKTVEAVNPKQIEPETIAQISQSLQNQAANLQSDANDFTQVTKASKDTKIQTPKTLAEIINNFCSDSKNASSIPTPVPSDTLRLTTNKFKNIHFFPTKKSDGKKSENEIVTHMRDNHPKTYEKLGGTHFSSEIGKNDPSTYDKICHISRQVIDSNNLTIVHSNKYQPDPQKEEFVYLDALKFTTQVKLGDNMETVTCVFSMPDEDELDKFKNAKPHGNGCLIMRSIYIDKM